MGMKDPPTSADGSRLAYSCADCGAQLGLTSDQLWPPDMFWQQGTRGSLSFVETPSAVLEPREETSCGPFYESSNSWGISRTRTCLHCRHCGARLGTWSADGPPSLGHHGQYGLGPSQFTHRATRYRLKSKLLRPSPIPPVPESVPFHAAKAVDLAGAVQPGEAGRGSRESCAYAGRSICGQVLLLEAHPAEA